MTSKIRYAGYDPDEHPLHCHSLAEIDPRRAEELRARGMPWRAVAETLTRETGRDIAFGEQSVAAAVWRASKRR